MTAELFTEGYRRAYQDNGVWVFSRYEFCALRYDYKPGEHVVYGGPSKRGKTQLAFDCLEHIATPEFPAYVAVSKPTDKVTRDYGEKLGFRFTNDWPAPKKWKEVFDGPPPGYVVWPRFGDINSDFENAAAVTARLMADRYSASARGEKRTSGILVMDDTMVKAKIMGLDNQMTTILAMAGAMHIGLWVFIQKPTDSGRTTLWAYENADHAFFTKGGDARMLDRYAQIAGEQGAIVKSVVPKLDRYQFFYLDKANGFICVVDAS